MRRLVNAARASQRVDRIAKQTDAWRADPFLCLSSPQPRDALLIRTTRGQLPDGDPSSRRLRSKESCDEHERYVGIGCR
jgi:hypothetical protein